MLERLLKWTNILRSPIEALVTKAVLRRKHYVSPTGELAVPHHTPQEVIETQRTKVQRRQTTAGFGIG